MYQPDGGAGVIKGPERSSGSTQWGDTIALICRPRRGAKGPAPGLRALRGWVRAGTARGSHPALGKPLLANTENRKNKLWFFLGLGNPQGRVWRLLQLQEQDSCSCYSLEKVLGWGTPSILPPSPPSHPAPERSTLSRGPAAGSWPHTTHSHGSQTRLFNKISF